MCVRTETSRSIAACAQRPANRLLLYNQPTWRLTRDIVLLLLQSCLSKHYLRMWKSTAIYTKRTAVIRENSSLLLYNEIILLESYVKTATTTHTHKHTLLHCHNNVMTSSITSSSWKNTSQLISYIPFIILKISIKSLLTHRLANRIKPTCFNLSSYCKSCTPVTSLVSLL